MSSYDVLNLLDGDLDGGGEVSPGEALLLAGAQQAEEEGYEALHFLLRAQLLLLRRENLPLAVDFLEQSLTYYLQGRGELDLSAFISSLLMEAYHRAGHMPRCVSVAREWVARSPKCVTANAALCHVLLEQEQLDDCILACAKAISSLQESVTMMSIYNTRGKCYRKQHKYEESVADFEKVKAMSASENLVRFVDIKQPFLTTTAAPTSPHATPHSEKHSLKSLLVSFVKTQPREPGQFPRERNHSLHFERGQHLPARLLTNNPGHVLDI